MDYTPLLRRALRASFAVRSGIVPSQSRFRGNDEMFLILRSLRFLMAIFAPDGATRSP
jgi:hypothetical protein